MNILFVIYIFCLLFMVITIYQYKQRVIESLANPDQNIISEPVEPTEKDKKKPDYLDLKDNSAQSIKNYVVRTVTNALSSIRPDSQGPPGDIGPQGPQGQSGGNYLFNGPLRSIKETKLVMDRKTNIPFMTNQTYLPQQTWILSSDNKIINLSNQNDCLNFDTTGNLNISNCSNSEKWKYIGNTAQVQAVKPIGGINKCLTLKNTPEKGVDNQFSLLLDDCNITGPDQAWNFI